MENLTKNNDIGHQEAGHLCVNTDILTANPASSLLMDVLEFIKENKIPQKALAKNMGISYYMFRKKISGTQVTFSEEELDQLKKEVIVYLEGLIKKFHNFVNYLCRVSINKYKSYKDEKANL